MIKMYFKRIKSRTWAILALLGWGMGMIGGIYSNGIPFAIGCLIFMVATWCYVHSES